METMRAVVASAPGGPDVLRLVELPVPAKTGSEFLIRIHAAGVNPIDVKTRAGQGPAALAEWPLVLGNDFSGTVV
ncbi:MAG TPA: alcohol dehydrogenase catalytic domain-containing protein, partial [Microbacteriaceae bacterium]|nr:alcohol dehydrogenase catalytic domain-containing protein [Microbacteriaceae bacterium]